MIYDHNLKSDFYFEFAHVKKISQHTLRSFYFIRIEKVEQTKNKDIKEQFFRDYLRDIKGKMEIKSYRGNELIHGSSYHQQ